MRDQLTLLVLLLFNVPRMWSNRRQWGIALEEHVCQLTATLLQALPQYGELT